MGTWLDSVKNEIDPVAWGQAANEKQQGNDPADFLLKGGHISTEKLLTSLSQHYGIASIILSQYEPDDEAVSKVPEELARRFSLTPLFTLKDRIFIATSEPGNLPAQDFIRQKTGLNVEELVTTKENVEQAINKYYLAGKRSAEKVKSIGSTEKTKEETAPSQVKLKDEDAPSIKLVDHIISSAIRLSASDIHLEPFENSVLLRYRLDGVLREYPPPPFDMIKAVTSRIKILSNLDVAERRLPQDGRSTFTVDGKDFDLRISIIPNLYGESVVIRILTSASNIKELDELGFSKDMLDKYKKMISMPHGVILVTGPTGSGKSTTLYATLRSILTPEKKILTLEDPVESQIKGVTQFQMNSQIGFTFASALRSVLRHDPEIVLVGEIRDRETADIAIRASLTGHMLFSTLHTNDAATAPTRLIDMGVPGYLVMTSLIGILAQRLVRRLCPKCKEPLKVEKSHLDALEIKEIPAGSTPYKPVGCGNCENTGYKGRAAIYELLEITPEIRRLPESEMTAEKIKDIAEKQGFKTLRQSGIEKWLSGVTSLEEIIKITVE